MSDTSAPPVAIDPLVQERLAAQQRVQARRSAERPDRNHTPGRRRSRVNGAQRWMRWVHVYTSMIAFLVILFFGVTGLLLNHPSWLGGDEVTTTRADGVLPASVVTDDGRVEFLAVSEYLRSEHGVSGEVTNFDQIASEGSINYTGPSYGASVRFDVTTLDYELTIRSEGFVNAMRDLHSGSDTNDAWNLVIDISAGFLVVVSVTGLGIQVLMKKRRRSALAWLAGGTAVAVALIWWTMV